MVISLQSSMFLLISYRHRVCMLLHVYNRSIMSNIDLLMTSTDNDEEPSTSGAGCHVQSF